MGVLAEFNEMLVNFPTTHSIIYMGDSKAVEVSRGWTCNLLHFLKVVKFQLMQFLKNLMLPKGPLNMTNPTFAILRRQPHV